MQDDDDGMAHLFEEDEEEENDDNFNMRLKQENFKNFFTGEWNRVAEKCYMTQDKVNLKDVTFLTLQNNILANNHIILCGMVHNLMYFIMPLRAKYLPIYPTIVILH